MSKLEPAQLIDRKNPIYPAVERTVHVSGSVQVRFHIGSDGRVSDVTVVSGNAILAKAAVDAVQGWRYKPATLNGTPIETEGSAVLAFTP
jgi:protein TonB